jgi:hypothetical protein
MPPIDLSANATPPPRRVPESFLRAEVAAFPLASERSFQLGLVALDPLLGEDNKTGELWRSCESQLAPHTGWSLDRLLAARDRGWFGAMSGTHDHAIPLHVYLQTLVRSHLSRRAGVTELEESTDLTALDAADHYRWLTLSLPEDLLLSALGIEPAPVRVDLNSPLLVRRLLDLGVAEIHQHIGAGMSFPLLWVSALAAIATVDVKDNALANPGAPLSEGKHLVRWLLAAAIARCTLAEFLIRGTASFSAFVDDAYLSSKNKAWTPLRCETLKAVIKALISGDEQRLPDIEQLRDLYADIHPTALTLKDEPIKSVDDAFRRCDPIAVRLNLFGKNAGERWLLRNAFAYLEGRQRANRSTADGTQHDDYFAHLFWQTTRVRCQYYRSVVQRPLTGGLQWFIRFYDRLGDLRIPLNPILPQVSYDIAGEGHRIRVLEFRTSLQSTATDIGEELLGYLLSWQQVLKENSASIFEPEMGIVFHFVKYRDDSDRKKGTPSAFWAGTYAEPNKKEGMDVVHGRYVDYFAGQCGKARALAELIEAVPSCLWVIRGLDVATDELGVPTWVIAPLFRHVLDASALASVREQDNAGPILNVTTHVAEDFRHLLEGMRHIYEHVHYILGGSKGRLGHAIALGVDPKSWAESVGSVLMPAEERLWDLVMEWRLYTRYRIRPEYAAIASPGRVNILLNKVRELSDYIYGKPGYRIEELAEAHHLLHRFLVPPYTDRPMVDGGYDTFLKAAQNIKRSSDQGRMHSPRRVGKILELYLDDESVFRRGQTLIDVPVRMDEVEALNAVQYGLRHGISQHGIVIEVNPSSNLLIGDLLDLRNHPILRLNPPILEPNSPPSVAIALGSDDPLTFSTDLLKEYTLLYQAACSAGYPEPAVQAWLESIRQTGMDARFTRAWRPNAKEKVEKLIEDLHQYLHKPSRDAT